MTLQGMRHAGRWVHASASGMRCCVIPACGAAMPSQSDGSTFATGLVTIYTEKSGGRIEVNIPIRRELAEALSAGPTGDLAWICGVRGEPLTKESFGNDSGKPATQPA